MEDLTLKITVEYNIRSENENADFDQRDFPRFSFFDKELQHHLLFIRQVIEQPEEASHFADAKEVKKVTPNNSPLT
jgi:hypothetical protein